MKTWEVETRATVRRVRIVTAEDEKAAIAASVDVEIEYEEDLDEETIDVRPSKSQDGGSDE